MDLAKRNSLIAKLQNQSPIPQPGYPILGVDEYFVGSTDRSIAGNLWPDHPGNPTFKRILNEIERKPSVQAVYVGVLEWPDPDEPEDNEQWLTGDCLYILSNASVEDVKGWLSSLHPLAVTSMTSWPFDPAVAPPMLPGYAAYYVCW